MRICLAGCVVSSVFPRSIRGVRCMHGSDLPLVLSGTKKLKKLAYVGERQLLETSNPTKGIANMSMYRDYSALIERKFRFKFIDLCITIAEATA